MDLEGNKRLYADCKHIQRTIPPFEVDKETAKQLGEEYRTLPQFEIGMFDYVYRRHYSVETNDLLKCRWKKYKHTYEQRVFAPFQFPEIRDLHFYKSCVRYSPTESIQRNSDFRMKLKPGPGVDFRGQIPIPLELFMKRGITLKEDNKKLIKKGGRKTTNLGKEKNIVKLNKK